MALTIRTNGSSGTNIITASWFNDIRDLLTGTMQDQEVTIKNVLSLLSIGAGPTVAPGGALATGTTLGIGAYQYVYTWVAGDGETLGSPVFNITTTTGNQKVNLTGIAVGPTGTTARKVYRTKVGATSLLLLTTISDNTTTTFSDTVADGSLGVAVPVSPSFGGSVFGKNSGGTETWRLYTDGRAALTGPQTVNNGSVSGTITAYFPVWGTGMKLALVNANNWQSASAAIVNFPSAYASMVGAFSLFTGSGLWIPRKAGANQSTTLITALGGSGAGTTSSQGNVQAASMGVILVTGIDSISVSNSSTPAANGLIALLGF